MSVNPFASVVWMLLILSAAHAQKAMNLDQHLLIKISDKTLYGDPAAEKVVGTPYLNDNFVIGVVYSHAVKYTGVSMRYNIYDDNIEFKQNNKLFILDPQQKINRVELDGRIYVIDSYEYKGKIRLGFFGLLDSGRVVLLSRNVVTYKEQQAPKALESGPTPAKYTRAPDTYFYRIGDGVLMKVDNIKKMIDGFPDKQTELTEFVKKEKISARKEADLLKLVKYYNSL